MLRIAISALATLFVLSACRDIQGFNTGSDRFQGPVIGADFVRSGFAQGVNLCLTLDTSQIEGSPGTVSTSDGLFASAPLRPIPQLWHDSLSTLSFGEGRTRNLLYVATDSVDAGGGADVLTVVSLMDSGKVEVRFLQGAPALPPDGGAASAVPNIFAVFTLDRQSGACPF